MAQYVIFSQVLLFLIQKTLCQFRRLFLHRTAQVDLCQDRVSVASRVQTVSCLFPDRLSDDKL